MLRMDLEYFKGILFVRLDGSLIRGTSYKINNYLIPVILKHQIKYLVYNFYNLMEIDDVGLDAILNTKSAVLGNKGLIYMCEVGEKIKKEVSKVHIKRFDNELIALKTIRV